MSKRDTISLIMPVFNGEAFIAEALESVLRQGRPPDEIIVVDDGSSDRSAEIAVGFEGVRVVRTLHRGLPAARNRGLEEASGGLIIIFDADDLLPADALAFLSGTLADEVMVDIAIGRVQLIGAAEHPEDGMLRVQTITRPFYSFTFGGSLIRRRAFDKVGRFDEAMEYCDDVDWFLRAREAGCSFSFQEQVTLYYRRHAGNMTRRRELDMQGLLRSFKGSLDRRRSKDGRVSALPSLGLFPKRDDAT